MFFSLFSLSSYVSFKKIEANIAIAVKETNIIIGKGSLISATNGAHIAIVWAHKLTIPKVVDTYLIGNNLLLVKKSVLYDIELPILLSIMNSGIKEIFQ